MNIETNSQQPTTSDKTEEESKIFNFKSLLKLLSFYLMGISFLISFNAIISGLDCFIYHHKEYYPDFIYSNLFFLFNFSFQIIFVIFPLISAPYKLIQISLAISA